jgi:hypothetical protein
MKTLAEYVYERCVHRGLIEVDGRKRTLLLQAYHDWADDHGKYPASPCEWRVARALDAVRHDTRSRRKFFLDKGFRLKKGRVENLPRTVFGVIYNRGRVA